MIDRKQIIYDLADQIALEYEPLKIILFGSHVWGTPHTDSDIDLLIVKETNERPIDRRIKVRSIISGTSLPFDLLVLTPQEITNRLQIKDQFVQEILDTGVVLYAAGISVPV